MPERLHAGLLFAACGGYLLVMIVVLSRNWSRFRKVAACLAATVFMLGPAYIMWPDLLERGGGTPFWSRPLFKEAMLFIAMLAGMTSRYFWELIEARRARNAARRAEEGKHGLDFDWWDFVQPLFVSVIVFTLVLQSGRDLTLSTFVFSFQNGFFWQTIFRKGGQGTGPMELPADPLPPSRS